MTHGLAMTLSFGLCAVVGLVLYLGALTSRAHESPAPGMVLMAVLMGGLLLFGLAGLTGDLTWAR